MDDPQLIERLKRGDPAARRQAWEQLKDPIFRAVCTFARVQKGWDDAKQEWVTDQQDAWDILEDTFVAFFRDIRKFNGKSSLFTWTYRIACNRAAEFYRQQMRQGVEGVIALPSQRASAPDDEANGSRHATEVMPLSFDIEEEQEPAPKKKPRVSRHRRVLAVQAASDWNSAPTDPTIADVSGTSEIRSALGGLTAQQAQVVTLRVVEEKSIEETATILGVSQGAVKMTYGRAIEQLRKLMGVAASETSEEASLP